MGTFFFTSGILTKISKIPQKMLTIPKMIFEATMGPGFSM
jgi:hypothetical protein